MDTMTRALQALTKLAEYVPRPFDYPEEVDPPTMKCKCGCGRELPLYKRRAVAQARRLRRKHHLSDRYFGLCWKKKMEEKIRKTPQEYALKRRDRDKDGPNIRKPVSGILNP